MPKRIGYLKEQVLTHKNCTRAVLVGTANLRKTESIKQIRANPEEYGEKILERLSQGWTPEPVREKTINEGTGHKVRQLQIPTTPDHLCHVAIMLPLIPYLERRFDFYSCGSIKGRGQRRVNETLKAWMKKPVKYAGEADIHHAYADTKPEVVMAALRRMVKDESYLTWHEQILEQMDGHLAIGFMPSHWYFNLIMTDIDTKIRQECNGIKLVRYMDNYVFAANRKRTVHKAIRTLIDETERIGLSVNDNWQVYRTSARPIEMLSYRYFPGYTLLRKKTMYSITKGVKRAGKKLSAHTARSAMSQIGLLRHCNSYNYRKNHVYPVVSIKASKVIISKADRSQ